MASHYLWPRIVVTTQALQPVGLHKSKDQDPQAEGAAEKVRSGPVLVAQPLLAVWFLQHLAKAHSQEWLCYSTFSVACEACATTKPENPSSGITG